MTCRQCLIALIASLSLSVGACGGATQSEPDGVDDVIDDAVDTDESDTDLNDAVDESDSHDPLTDAHDTEEDVDTGDTTSVVTCDPGTEPGDGGCVDVDECATENGGCDQVCTNLEGAFACSCDAGWTLAADGASCEDVDECATENGGCAQDCHNHAGSFTCSCSSGWALAADGAGCEDVDECGTDNGGCDQVCQNREGSFDCSCSSGWTLATDRVSCVDVDECQTGNGGCQQVCENGPGGFVCTCSNGWVLADDDASCEDVDECTTDNGGCAQQCDNEAGGFTCSCSAGWTLAEDGLGCDDVDECDAANGGCAQACVNDAGGFHCACGEGWALAEDGSACVDVDECAADNGGCAQRCSNEAGGFVCSCLAGWTLAEDGLGCDDVDECGTANGGCAQRCINSEGGFDCGCDDGWVLASDGVGCDDVNECLNGVADCAQGCIDEPGGFYCVCLEGWSLAADERGCDDIDECQINNGGCAQTCHNTAGSFTCSCDAGWELAADGRGCNDIDECATGEASCGVGTVCSNIPGGFACVCAPGWTETATGCEDVDECATANGGCEQSCVNSPGGYACSCGEGFSLHPDGASCLDLTSCADGGIPGFAVVDGECVDIDECATDNGGCAQICENSPGTYVCSCVAGFQLVDDHGCIDIDECSIDNGGCSQRCENVAGSYLCGCEPGWQLSANGADCEDVDECADANGGCELTCTNLPGTFRCGCLPGEAELPTGGCVPCPDGCERCTTDGVCEECLPGHLPRPSGQCQLWCDHTDPCEVDSPCYDAQLCGVGPCFDLSLIPSRVIDLKTAFSDDDPRVSHLVSSAGGQVGVRTASVMGSFSPTGTKLWSRPTFSMIEPAFFGEHMVGVRTTTYPTKTWVVTVVSWIGNVTATVTLSLPDLLDEDAYPGDLLDLVPTADGVVVIGKVGWSPRDGLFAVAIDIDPFTGQASLASHTWIPGRLTLGAAPLVPLEDGSLFARGWFSEALPPENSPSEAVIRVLAGDGATTLWRRPDLSPSGDYYTNVTMRWGDRIVGFGARGDDVAGERHGLAMWDATSLDFIGRRDLVPAEYVTKTGLVRGERAFHFSTTTQSPIVHRIVETDLDGGVRAVYDTPRYFDAATFSRGQLVGGSFSTLRYFPMPSVACAPDPNPGDCVVRDCSSGTCTAAVLPDGVSCEDGDPCSRDGACVSGVCQTSPGPCPSCAVAADGLGGCEQLCDDGPDGVTCSCEPGFVLASDGLGCDPVDSCLERGCDQRCVVGPDGTAACVCDQGWYLDADGVTCVLDLADPCQLDGSCETSECWETDGVVRSLATVDLGHAKTYGYTTPQLFAADDEIVSVIQRIALPSAERWTHVVGAPRGGGEPWVATRPYWAQTRFAAIGSEVMGVLDDSTSSSLRVGSAFYEFTAPGISTGTAPTWPSDNAFSGGVHYITFSEVYDVRAIDAGLVALVYVSWGTDNSDFVVFWPRQGEGLGAPMVTKVPVSYGEGHLTQGATAGTALGIAQKSSSGSDYYGRIFEVGGGSLQKLAYLAALGGTTNHADGITPIPGGAVYRLHYTTNVGYSVYEKAALVRTLFAGSAHSTLVQLPEEVWSGPIVWGGGEAFLHPGRNAEPGTPIRRYRATGAARPSITLPPSERISAMMWEHDRLIWLAPDHHDDGLRTYTIRTMAFEPAACTP